MNKILQVLLDEDFLADSMKIKSGETHGEVFGGLYIKKKKMRNNSENL